MTFNRVLFIPISALGLTVLMLSAAVFALPRVAKTASPTPPISIRDVKTVWQRSALGNATFNARLRAELAAMGLRFVSDSAAADVILDCDGHYSGRGFVGKMRFSDHHGRVIYAENSFRPESSRVMAYQTLAERLRARRR